MRGARSYVLRDEVFGLIGAGCTLEEKGGRIKVVPKDGLRKAVVYPEKKLRVHVTQAEIDWMSFDPLELSLVDTTGIVKQAEFRVEGLAPRTYSVRHGSSRRSERVSGVLELSVPIAEAKSIVIS
jgi:hypothetical protein